MDFYFFFAYFAAMLGQGLDAYTTSTGLSKGLIESNTWLKNWIKGHTALNGFLKIGLAPFVIVILGAATHELLGAAIANTILAGFGFFAAIRNFAKLRKAKA